VRKIEYKKRPDIAGRELELWLVIEVMLQSLGADDNEIELAKKRFLSQYGFSEYEPSEFEEEVVKSILNQLQENTEITLSPKEISETIDPEVFQDKETPKQRAAKVGWAIKKFNLASEKKARTKDGICYLFQKTKVENLYRTYFKVADEHTSLTPSEKSGLNSEDLVV
jgi:hypothetical protein